MSLSHASLHRSVREGIAAFRNNGQQQQRQEQGGQEEETETAGQLLIRGRRWEPPLNLHSIQHLVAFLRETENSSDNNNNNETAAAAADGAAADGTTATATAAVSPPPPPAVVTHLKLHAVTIHNQNGRELDLLRDYFLPTTKKSLTKVTLMGCTLGRTADDVERLLSAFYPDSNNNTTTTTASSSSSSSSIVHLDFWRLSPQLHGAALGRCLANIVQNNPTLQRLECWGCPLLGAAGVAALQTALSSSQYHSNSNNRESCLIELNLSGCSMGDAGLTCLATAIANNPHSSLQILNLSGANQITIQGMETGILQLATCERLRKIDFGHDVLVQVLRHGTHSWQLARVLCRSNLYLQKLVGITHAHFPDCRPVVTAIRGILSRNQLLAPQPLPGPANGDGELLDSNSGIWSVALAKYARQSRSHGGDNEVHSPATCIFQILQRRPFLVPFVQRRRPEQEQEAQLLPLPPVAMIPPPPSPPPPPPMVATARQDENNHPNGGSGGGSSSSSSDFLATATTAGNSGPNKRARFE